jgi:hypothetical protein
METTVFRDVMPKRTMFRRNQHTKFAINEMFYLGHSCIWVFPKRLYVSAGKRDVPYQKT